ncbi:MAG TPA: hypothetical protein PKD00_09930 [Burkholderiales bacterium]|nr:hypothetical protein [Burkholderiales bacterium]
MEFISIKTALADYNRSSGRVGELNEDSILQWASDCMETIGSYRQYLFNIAVLDINNYRAELPKDFMYVDLALYREGTSCSDTLFELSEIITPILDSDCEIKSEKICKTCCGAPIITDAEPWLIKNYPWHGYSRVVETHNTFSNYRTNKLTAMKLDDKAATKFHLNDSENIHAHQGVKYTIQNKIITTSEKSGQIILFYLGQVTDEDGYPMILNNINFITAIFYYIEMKFAWMEYSAEKTQGNRMFFRDAEQLANTAIARTVAELNTPTWEEAKAISEMLNQRIPNTSLYGKNLNYQVQVNKMVNNAGYKSAPTFNRFK